MGFLNDLDEAVHRVQGQQGVGLTSMKDLLLDEMYHVNLRGYGPAVMLKPLHEWSWHKQHETRIERYRSIVENGGVLFE